MRIQDFIGKDFVIGTGPDMSVRDAAKRMAEEGVGCLVVVDRQGALIGVVTDRDLVVRVLAPGEDPDTTSVAEAMTSSPATITEGAGIEDAASRMREAHVRRLPVVDAKGHVVGVLSLDDVLSALGRQVSDLAAVVEDVCRTTRAGAESR